MNRGAWWLQFMGWQSQTRLSDKCMSWCISFLTQLSTPACVCALYHMTLELLP